MDVLPAQASKAPSSMLFDISGTSKSGSTIIFAPRPSHSGQAPKGLLNENILGDNSSILKPQMGQAKLELKRSSSCPIISTKSWPPDIFSAVSIESANLLRTSSFTTIRSTITSIECFLFFSSSMFSDRSRCSPSTRTRTNPCLEISAKRLLCSPFLPEITGAKICSLVFSGYCIIRSTICSTVCDVISMPCSGQCG
ncbi:hypothetical protein D3C76_660070 [compost metagenome]